MSKFDNILLILHQVPRTRALREMKIRQIYGYLPGRWVLRW